MGETGVCVVHKIESGETGYRVCVCVCAHVCVALWPDLVERVDRRTWLLVR